MTPRRRAPLWAFIVFGLIGAGFVATSVVTFLSFRHEARLHRTPYGSGPKQLTDGLLVSAKTRKVDTSTESATFRLTFEPKGAYADASGSLTQPLTIYTEADQGWVPKHYAEGQPMRSQDVTTSLFDGFQADSGTRPA